MNTAGTTTVERNERARIVDAFGRLNPFERLQIEQAIAALPATAPPEVVVLLTDAVPGRTFREHAIRARQEHARDKANSIILVIALDDRHVELATAPRFANWFTPEASTELLQQHFVPQMRAGNLAAATVRALTAIGEVCATGGPPPRPRPRRRVSVSAVLLLIATAGLFVWRYVQDHTCRQCGGWGDVTRVELVAPTRNSEGLEQFSFKCRRCGAAYTEQRTLSRESDSSDDSSSSSDSDGGGGADW